MKIATWNLERPTTTGKKNASIESALAAVNADIFILTETNESINPGSGYYSIHSVEAAENFYTEGERRVSIFSKYPFRKQIPTFNAETALCVQIQTPEGELAIYGTIIGTHGNREASFQTDLELQILDFNKIAAEHGLCIAGDFNISFSDNYYYTKAGRDSLTGCFDLLGLVNTTADISENIDHIILPKSFIDKKPNTEEWNRDKKLSDHIGVAVTLY